MRPRVVDLDIRKAKQIERGAADAVLIDLEAMPSGFVRREGQRGQLRPCGVKLRALGLKGLRPLWPNRAEIDALAGQPLVGIIGPQAQPIFGARGEHAIRLGNAARHEIVDHHAEVGLGPVEGNRGDCRPPEPPRSDRRRGPARQLPHSPSCR